MYQCDLLGAPLLRTFHHLVFLVTLCFPVSFLPMSSGLPLRLPQVWVIAKNSHNGPKHWRLFPAKLSCWPRSLVPSFVTCPSGSGLHFTASLLETALSTLELRHSNRNSTGKQIRSPCIRIFQDDFFLVDESMKMITRPNTRLFPNLSAQIRINQSTNSPRL